MISLSWSFIQLCYYLSIFYYFILHVWSLIYNITAVRMFQSMQHKVDERKYVCDVVKIATRFIVASNKAAHSNRGFNQRKRALIMQNYRCFVLSPTTNVVPDSSLPWLNTVLTFQRGRRFII